MKNKKKTIEPRNPYALALESPIFRQKIKESKKRGYNRQKDKEELRKAVNENTAFLLPGQFSVLRSHPIIGNRFLPIFRLYNLDVFAPCI